MSTSNRPPASSEEVRARMQRQPRSATRPEMELRRQLWHRGLRYRVGYNVPGMPRRSIDLAFTKAKVAVFVDGCFWHKCPEHFVTVKNNAAWWASKIESNVARDRETDELLDRSGWRVVRVWEHEPVDASVKRVVTALEGQKTP